MKHAWWLGLLLLVCGCDYSVPLVDAPAGTVDEQVLGLWHTTGADGQPLRMLVLRPDANTYTIVYPFDVADGLFFRGVPCAAAGLPLLQVEWYGTSRESLSAAQRTYQYAAWEMRGDALHVRLLNPEVVDKTVASPAALAEAIAAARDDPALFRELAVFTRPPPPAAQAPRAVSVGRVLRLSPRRRQRRPPCGRVPSRAGRSPAHRGARRATTRLPR